METRHLPCDADPATFSGVVATSANAIEALARQTSLRGLIAYCVGDATAAAARAAGMRAISAAGDAADLIALIRAAAPAGPLLYPRGAVVRTDLASALEHSGISLHSAIVYEQHPAGLSPEAIALLGSDAPVVLPLFSPRSAALAAQAMTASRAALHLAAISRAAANDWTGPTPTSVAIAERPDAQAMTDLIARIYIGSSS